MIFSYDVVLNDYHFQNFLKNNIMSWYSRQYSDKAIRVLEIHYQNYFWKYDNDFKIGKSGEELFDFYFKLLSGDLKNNNPIQIQYNKKLNSNTLYDEIDEIKIDLELYKEFDEQKPKFFKKKTKNTNPKTDKKIEDIGPEKIELCIEDIQPKCSASPMSCISTCVEDENWKKRLLKCAKSLNIVNNMYLNTQDYKDIVTKLRKIFKIYFTILNIKLTEILCAEFENRISQVLNGFETMEEALIKIDEIYEKIKEEEEKEKKN